ncbi:hypothetical protein P691DRAFT_282129 [Macrolepiota fuliginosa MF-IS2]|uniref:Uncharacterized protein n=1 Tax=Macrolepiota fuliginosa MF-IS2 TaxID=1400762 RepID=A0A9P5X6Z5_9AGAR|nr:hypothetical protein P691DRAFT_282129 [Macrolepiota fuliginosa MF-IS2]
MLVGEESRGYGLLSITNRSDSLLGPTGCWNLGVFFVGMVWVRAGIFLGEGKEGWERLCFRR